MTVMIMGRAKRVLERQVSPAVRILAVAGAPDGRSNGEIWAAATS
jgi:hypothetical protein